MEILAKRRIDASEDWRDLGEKISGRRIEEFDIEKYQPEYTQAEGENKDETYLGKFFLAAMKQKSMVTNKIFKSGNPLAGLSVEYGKKGFRGIKDYFKIVEEEGRRNRS